MSEEEIYVCVGICQPDPDSGYCLGCGRPPLDSPAVVVLQEPSRPGQTPATTSDPDTPE